MHSEGCLTVLLRYSLILELLQGFYISRCPDSFDGLVCVLSHQNLAVLGPHVSHTKLPKFSCFPKEDFLFA